MPSFSEYGQKGKSGIHDYLLERELFVVVVFAFVQICVSPGQSVACLVN